MGKKSLYVITFTKVLNGLTIRLQGLVEATSKMEATKLGTAYAKDHLKYNGYCFEYVSMIHMPSLKEDGTIILL